MTLFFHSHQIEIRRQRKIGSANRFAMSATFTTYQADIQPASQERTEMVNGRFGKVYLAFVDPSVSVKEGDQIQVIGGSRYSVKGVSSWQGAGLLDHKELIIVAQD